MPTSGTYTFSMNAQSLCQAALRQTGRFTLADTIPTADMQNALQALNLVVKSLPLGEKPLWCVQRVTLPLVAGTSSYNLAALTGQTRPLRVLAAYLRASTGNDVMLEQVARDDYNTLGQKTSQGRPNQFFYDPQLTGATLTFYNVPFTSTDVVILDLQRQMQDVNALTDLLDIPQEAYQMLKWVLADELKLEYLTPQDMRAEIAQRAATTKELFFSSDREQASTFFTPSERMANGSTC